MDYNTKFKSLIEATQYTTKRFSVIICCPEVLGDTYDEILQSLKVIGESKHDLTILSTDALKKVGAVTFQRPHECRVSIDKMRV
jgi:hypothetical protein